MSEELPATVPNEFGLKCNPDDFSYQSTPRPKPQPGQLYERADLCFLEEVSYRPLHWFWTGVIPWNKLTVIEGPPQSAKSLLAIELAARASRGEPLPGDAPDDFRAFSVQLVSGYDDLHDTLLPRIKRAGGDVGKFSHMSRIARSRGDYQTIGRRRLVLPGDIGHFEESISDMCADMVFVDPLTCFCRSGRDVIATLELLEDLASRIGIPIITTLSAKTSRHPLGGWESKPEYADAPARCVWSIVADEDEPGRWLFVPIRMTFATPAAGMAFRIVDGRIAWEPLPALPIAEYDEPVAWLWSVLKEGPMRSSHIQKQAKEYGISVKMLRRARRVLKVEIRGEGSRENFSTVWSLTGSAAQPGSVQQVSLATPAEPAGRLAGPVPSPNPADEPVPQPENAKNDKKGQT